MILIKLGEKNHLESFRKGHLYLNLLSFFQDLEDDVFRGDCYEGTHAIIQPSNLELHIDPGIPGIQPLIINASNSSELLEPARLSLDHTLTCNVFCMFAVYDPIDNPVFPNEYSWPGDSFVIVSDASEFLKRVSKCIKANGLRGEAKLVEYYDKDTYSGKTGVFRKPSIYSYQREYRIVVEPGAGKPLLLRVGDLEDITSIVIPFETANELKASYNNVRPANQAVAKVNESL